MAEKYGEVPKRFTAAWWQYFWMYYKWHTIGTAVVILMIVVTAVQCAGREKYDLNVTYVGSSYYGTDVIDSVINEITPYVADADGNGEVSVFMQQLNITNSAGSAEMDYTMQVKHDLELSNDFSFLFLYDEDQAKLMANRESAGDTYMPVSEWCDQDIDDSSVLKTADGEPIIVKVEDSRILNSSGMTGGSFYVAVRLDYSDNDMNTVSHQSAVDIANEMLKK